MEATLKSTSFSLNISFKNVGKVSGTYSTFACRDARSEVLGKTNLVASCSRMSLFINLAHVEIRSNFTYSGP
jgi:hypothetical protein